MTKLGKTLVVFAFGASFAFLGFAWVSLMAGTNWDAEAAALPGYSIQKGEGPDGKWTAVDRVTGKAVSVPTGNVEASAVIAVRKDLDKQQKDEIAAANSEAETYAKRLAEVHKYNEADTKALQTRVQVLTSQLEELNKTILSLSNDVVKRSQEAQALRTEATKRREDVFRLTRELAEIQADHFRSGELAKKLQDQLARLEGAVTGLESRNKQLREEGARLP